MATIHGKIAFGVKIELKTPVMIDEEKLKMLVSRAEVFLSTALLVATQGAVKLLPGVTATFTDAKARLDVDKVS